jgi:hypothetical protein
MRVLPLLARAGLLEVLRDRVLEDLLALPRGAVERDVLELRDPGGEDVRVAKPRPYGRVTPATGITGACRGAALEADSPVRNTNVTRTSFRRLPLSHT